jgi:hypothetical protein
MSSCILKLKKRLYRSHNVHPRSIPSLRHSPVIGSSAQASVFQFEGV